MTRRKLFLLLALWSLFVLIDAVIMGRLFLLMLDIRLIVNEEERVKIVYL